MRDSPTACGDDPQVLQVERIHRRGPFAVKGKAQPCTLTDHRGRGTVGPLRIEVVIGSPTDQVGPADFHN